MDQLGSLALAFLLGIPQPAVPSSLAPDPGGGTQIRIQDSRLAGMLADGVRRSPTLQSLVEQVQGGSVIVFVQTVRWLPNEAAGILTWVGAGPLNRFVRVSLKSHVSGDALLANLGHELQHVIEVMAAPWVSDSQSLLALYRHIGHPTNFAQSSWDSADAKWTGDQVLRELKGPATAAAADDVR